MKTLLLLVLFFIPFAKFQVGHARVTPANTGCSFVSAGYRCGQDCNKATCEGGIEGFIKLDTNIQFLSLQILDRHNQIKDTVKLYNPPDDINYYTDPDNVNRDRWIYQKLESKEIEVKRDDKIQLNSNYGFIFADHATVLYEDENAMNKKGTLEELKEELKNGGSKNPETVKIQCYYMDRPNIMKSDRCPNETSCTGKVGCYINRAQHIEATVFCRSETEDTCPSPTQCMLDDTRHSKLSKPLNAKRLMKYYSNDQQPEENQPVEIVPNWGSGGGVQ